MFRYLGIYTSISSKIKDTQREEDKEKMESEGVVDRERHAMTETDKGRDGK